jgi:uncharacterized repeat protein (TIGR03803 family)
MRRKLPIGLTTLALIALTLSGTATRAAAQQEKVLHSFQANSRDGIHSFSTLIFDASGNFYGTTQNGGAYGYGTAFEFSPHAGGGWTEKILHNFNNNGKDGYAPIAGLTFDAAGNLYGTTSQGGLHYAGTVFKLVPHAAGNWTETILHSFGAATDGYGPDYSGLVIDSAGNLYGTTVNGGIGTGCGSFGCGTVFELTPTSSGSWTEAILHSFSNNGTDGELPEAGLTLDAVGNLYGTTFQGGAGLCTGGSVGCGTAFELIPTVGGAWTEVILHDFTYNFIDGYGLVSGLTLDAAGNLYGTTFYGGTG